MAVVTLAVAGAPTVLHAQAKTPPPAEIAVPVATPLPLLTSERLDVPEPSLAHAVKARKDTAERPLQAEPPTASLLRLRADGSTGPVFAPTAEVRQEQEKGQEQEMEDIEPSKEVLFVVGWLLVGIGFAIFWVN